jgi:hypothetical protein
MAESVSCLRCQTPMEQGFISDRAYGANRPEKWEPGEPTYLWHGKSQALKDGIGILTHPKDELVVTTMRCPKCGALESYARQA